MCWTQISESSTSSPPPMLDLSCNLKVFISFISIYDINLNRINHSKRQLCASSETASLEMFHVNNTLFSINTGRRDMPCFYFSSVLENKAFTLRLLTSLSVNEDEERCKPKADQYKVGFKTSVKLLTPWCRCCTSNHGYKGANMCLVPLDLPLPPQLPLKWQ